MAKPTVQEQTELLRELQSIDSHLSQLDSLRGNLEDRQADLDAEVGQVQELVDDLQTQLEQVREERRELAQALTTEQANASRSENRLPSIKTQKEYVAVLKEIDTAKKMIKDLEDQTEAKDTEIGNLTEDLEGKQKELAALNETLEAQRAEIRKELDVSEKNRSGKEKERKETLGHLPSPVRKRYELLLDRREGVAVVAARGGACTGCHMHLPPQIYNNLFLAQELQACPHCNRLLFVETEG